jgi:hypothetical protein
LRTSQQHGQDWLSAVGGVANARRLRSCGTRNKPVRLTASSWSWRGSSAEFNELLAIDHIKPDADSLNGDVVTPASQY